MSWHRTQIALVVTIAPLLAGGIVAVLGFTQGARPLSVQSGSMVPTFRKGDLVITKPVPDKQYAVGDIITFINPRNKKETITHRIVAVPPHDAAHSPKVITKGDANKAPDGYIPVHLILGKVDTSLPYAGHVLDFLRQPVGLLLVIYIPALTIVISEIRRLAVYYKQLEPYVAAGFDPNEHAMAERKKSPTGIRLAKAGSTATVVIASIAAPTVHAALISSVTISDSSISVVNIQPLTHPLISKVAFGGNAGSNNTTVHVINNNPQSAASGNAVVNDSSGNATTGSASNSSGSSFSFNVSHGSGSNVSATVTLYNPTSNQLDLSGWVLVDNQTNYTLPPGTVIASHDSRSFGWPATSALSRTSDRLLLRNSAGAIIDVLSWGSDNSQLNPPVVVTPTTATLVRTNPQVDTNMATDWHTN